MHSQDPSLLTKLPTTLEEMYKGSTRKMKISRTIHDGASGKATRVSEVLSIDIKPGWKSGTKVCAACFGCLLTSAEHDHFMHVVNGCLLAAHL
jgi:DnaJ C terminal domain